MIPLNFYWSFSASGVEPENGLFRQSNSSVKIIFRLGINFTCQRNAPFVCLKKIEINSYGKFLKTGPPIHGQLKHFVK